MAKSKTISLSEINQELTFEQLSDRLDIIQKNVKPMLDVVCYTASLQHVLHVINTTRRETVSLIELFNKDDLDVLSHQVTINLDELFNRIGALEDHCSGLGLDDE